MTDRFLYQLGQFLPVKNGSTDVHRGLFSLRSRSSATDVALVRDCLPSTAFGGLPRAILVIFDARGVFSIVRPLANRVNRRDLMDQRTVRTSSSAKCLFVRFARTSAPTWTWAVECACLAAARCGKSKRYRMMNDKPPEQDIAKRAQTLVSSGSHQPP